MITLTMIIDNYNVHDTIMLLVSFRLYTDQDLALHFITDLDPDQDPDFFFTLPEILNNIFYYNCCIAKIRVDLKEQYRYLSLMSNGPILSSVAEPEPVKPKLFWDLEPEPKINFNKHFLQSVWRMLG